MAELIYPEQSQQVAEEAVRQLRGRGYILTPGEEMSLASRIASGIRRYAERAFVSEQLAPLRESIAKEHASIRNTFSEVRRNVG